MDLSIRAAVDDQDSLQIQPVLRVHRALIQIDVLLWVALLLSIFAYGKLAALRLLHF